MHSLPGMLMGLVAVGLAAQPAPRVLKGPSDWRFERMPTPPAFAPDLKLSGFEEARFAPGMFDNSSANYFTYALIFVLDSAPDLDSAALREFLEQYFRGLSVSVGRQKGMTPDPAQIVAEVTPWPDEKNRSTAKVTFIDTFTDGRKVTLNLEMHVVPRPAERKTGLVMLISPHAKDHAVWQKLREIEGTLSFGGSQ